MISLSSPTTLFYRVDKPTCTPLKLDRLIQTSSNHGLSSLLSRVVNVCTSRETVYAASDNANPSVDHGISIIISDTEGKGVLSLQKLTTDADSWPWKPFVSYWVQETGKVIEIRCGGSDLY